MNRVFRLCLGALSIALAATLQAWAAPPKLDQSGRWLLDPDGRVVMIRGGNLQLPGAPGGKAEVTSPAVPRLLAEQGFNGVRLVIFFSELMPEPGRISEGYLEAIARDVAAYRDAGVHVLIDFHQDEYGAAVGVRGFPAWATFSGGHAPKRPPFPAGYFSDPAVHAAFDNFWKNHPVRGTGKGVQDLYIDALVAVARRFRDEPAVFGIDVMNEPFPGSRCNQPDPDTAHCPELERALLAPFYRRAGAAIAAAAPDLIVFVEPFMLQGALGIPIDTPAPGAARRGLSYHQYGTLAEIRQRGNRHALASAERTRSAILNTEWGFTNDPAEWTAQAEELDALLIPWLAWARGPFAPLIDPALPAAGNDNREATLRALARPYPRATAGTPLKLAFAGDTGTLDYEYASQGVGGRRHPGGGITEIAMPKANYPAGYTVAVAADQATVISEPDAPVLRLRAAPQAERIKVRAVRKGELPPLPEIVATEDPYAFLNQQGGAKPADGRLSTHSMLGDLLGDERARAILDREVPELVRSPQIGMGSQMTLRALQPFVPALLNEEVLDKIDRALAELPPRRP